MLNKSSCISRLSRHAETLRAANLASSTHVVTKQDDHNPSGRSRIKYGMTPNFKVRRSGDSLTSNTGGTVAKHQTPDRNTRGKTDRGFTLIELLVVVLIIGILASIALPQYRKAVEKARFSTYRAIANGVDKAARVYYLANGSWPTSVEELDVDLPPGMTYTDILNGTCGENSNMYCCFMFPSSARTIQGCVFCGTQSLLYGRVFASYDGSLRDDRRCYAKDPFEKSVCESLNPVSTGTTYAPTPTGWVPGYVSYHLP